jgi:hypothetical protein
VFICSSVAIRQREAHEIRLSIEVSIGLVLRDLRKDARPGVRATDVDGMRK